MSKNQSKSVKTATKSPKNEKKRLSFSEFVVQDLKKEERIVNVTAIVGQDIYLFLGRLGEVGHPEWEAIAKEVEELMADPKVKERYDNFDEGWMNRQKDKAIRQLYIFELMRQYTNFLREENATMDDTNQTSLDGNGSNHHEQTNEV